MPKRRKKRKKNKGGGNAGAQRPAPKALPWYQYYLPRIRFFLMLAVALAGLTWILYKTATEEVPPGEERPFGLAPALSTPSTETEPATE